MYCFYNVNTSVPSVKYLRNFNCNFYIVIFLSKTQRGLLLTKKINTNYLSWGISITTSFTVISCHKRERSQYVSVVFHKLTVVFYKTFGINSWNQWAKQILKLFTEPWRNICAELQLLNLSGSERNADDSVNVWAFHFFRHK